MTLECWPLRKHSKAFGNFRTPSDIVGKPRKCSNAFGSLGNILTPSGLLVAFGKPNLDRGVLVPSETFKSFWELADASGHRGKAVFERLRKPWKYSDAFGTFGNLRVSGSLSWSAGPFGNFRKLLGACGRLRTPWESFASVRAPSEAFGSLRDF